jgi:hypothetical protein
MMLAAKNNCKNYCEAQKTETAFRFYGVNNPKFDKRYKMGEDAFLGRPRFLCVLDGVGGWSDLLIDPGKMTKEFI